MKTKLLISLTGLLLLAAVIITAHAITACSTVETIMIPGGEYIMGCLPDDQGCDADEYPRHPVKVASFYMDKYEVTQSEFKRVMGFNPSYFKDCCDCPVETVNWFDAAKFCERVGKRLPTEAEWEWAARGGLENALYPWGDERANCDLAVLDMDPVDDFGDGCGRKATWPVGSRPQGCNAYGLCDMAGNVYEWCSDWYDPDYYKQAPIENPQGPAQGEFRVIRGGCWQAYPARYLRSSNRFWEYHYEEQYALGFRCVKDSD